MDESRVIRIDGSYGEGGGQILRTALALSAITGRGLELFNIRKNRPKPGLGNQHLTTARAVAKIAGAKLEGDRFGSTMLRVMPGAIRSGEFAFDVAEERGSAGSVTLVLQTILPILAHAPGPSMVELFGGTHVPFSPPVPYVQEVLLPMLARLGLRASLSLETAGWYPKGGGRIHARVEPVGSWKPASWTSPGALRQIRGWSLVSNLPPSIAHRQEQAVMRTLRPHRLEASVVCEMLPSPGQGTCVVLVAEFEQTLTGVAALGKPGKPAEAVGREAAEALLRFRDSGTAIDEHLADQLVVFLAMAGEASAFTTSRITRHLLTNLWVIQQCLPVRATVTGHEGEPGRVTIESSPAR